jgi:hypothetical protein
VLYQILRTIINLEFPLLLTVFWYLGLYLYTLLSRGGNN